MSILDRIRIVLIQTSHPGNIGSAARAMKTMGLKRLYLVSPKEFPHRKAHEMASGATDVVDASIVVETLDEAVKDCSLVLGTSARDRAIPWPLINPREMGETISEEPGDSEIAIVFGREQSGLTNDELQRCHMHIQIPANPDYSSLNLAAAVQVLAYECRMASLHNAASELEWDFRHATADELEYLFAHLQSVLVELNFLKAQTPRQVMTRLRRFFFRARPDVMEMNIFRGFLAAIDKQMEKNKEEQS